MYASWLIPKTKLKTNPPLIGHWRTLFSPVRQFRDIRLEMGPNSIGTMVVSISLKKDVTIKTDCLLLPVWLWMMWTWPYYQLMSCAMYVYYAMKCGIYGVLLGCITKIAYRLARLLGGNGSCKLQVRGVVSMSDLMIWAIFCPTKKSRSAATPKKQFKNFDFLSIEAFWRHRIFCPSPKCHLRTSLAISNQGWNANTCKINVTYVFCEEASVRIPDKCEINQTIKQSINLSICTLPRFSLYGFTRVLASRWAHFFLQIDTWQ